VNSPQVAVIIPVRNGERFIAQAIDSILSQTLVDLELLVVDDASTDRTVEIIHAYTDPRLRVLRNPQRMGVSASRNRALAEAHPSYVAFLDADDIAYDQRLEQQIAFLEQHPRVALVGCHLDYIDADGKLLYSERPGQRPCNPEDVRMELLKRACILPSTATGRKSALIQAGGFPQLDYAEDHDLWCRLALNHDLAILPDRLVAYRHHPNQATFKKISEAHKATQACIRRARGRFVAAGILQPRGQLSSATIWEHLCGVPGSRGNTYTQWAGLHSWALRQPRQALSLASTALLFSPLNIRAWKIFLRSTEQLLLPAAVSRALHWYSTKLRSLLNRKASK
jgi:hypothetical protein